MRFPIAPFGAFSLARPPPSPFAYARTRSCAAPHSFTRSLWRDPSSRMASRTEALSLLGPDGGQDVASQGRAHGHPPNPSARNRGGGHIRPTCVCFFAIIKPKRIFLENGKLYLFGLWLLPYFEYQNALNPSTIFVLEVFGSAWGGGGNRDSRVLLQRFGAGRTNDDRRWPTTSLSAGKTAYTRETSTQALQSRVRVARSTVLAPWIRARARKL